MRSPIPWRMFAPAAPQRGGVALGAPAGSLSPTGAGRTGTSGSTYTLARGACGARWIEASYAVNHPQLDTRPPGARLRVVAVHVIAQETHDGGSTVRRDHESLDAPPTATSARWADRRHTRHPAGAGWAGGQRR